LGNFTAKLCVDENGVRELIYVAGDLERPLLGRDASEKVKLVNRVDTVSSDDHKTKRASKHPQLFSGLGQMKDSYTIATQRRCQAICNYSSKKGTSSIVPENKE